jgi:5,10-methylenetetrahydrofolate reductase
LIYKLSAGNHVEKHLRLTPAGAQFFQTNVIYDLAALESWMNAIAKRNVLGKVKILVGIYILKSLAMAQHLDREIPGVFSHNRLWNAWKKPATERIGKVFRSRSR